MNVMPSSGVYNNGFIHDNGKNESNAKETNFEKVERLPFGTTKEKKANGQLIDDYDPYAHRQVEHPITNFDTVVHLIKSALGSGIFSIPNAFNHAGYCVGLIGTIMLASITTYCVHLLVKIHYDLCKKKKVPSLSYPLVGEAALMHGPGPVRKFAPHMIHVINAFLLVYQIGVSSIYVVFISDNFKALIDHAFDVDIDKRYVMLGILLPLCMANWIQNLKYLSPLSTIGNGVTLVSFGVICYYVFREPLTLEGKRPVATLSEFPQFFGTVLFALEAIGVILPLENEMKRPKDFGGSTGILNRAMLLVISLYVGLGLCGYLKYGSDVKATITLNLPATELLAQCVKGMIGCGVFITHVVALYVAIDIAWTQYILKRVENSPRKSLCNYILRTTLVLLTFALAVLIPNLNIFITFIGALTLSMLGILFPAFLDSCGRWYTTSGWAKAWMLFRNFVIGCIGLAGFVVGTSLSIQDIFEIYT